MCLGPFTSIFVANTRNELIGLSRLYNTRYHIDAGEFARADRACRTYKQSNEQMDSPTVGLILL